MTLDVGKVEAILRKHWQIAGDVNLKELHDHAFRISVMIGQKYAHDNLKYQLGLIQTKYLKQNLDEAACDQIASDLLSTSHS
jgi:hypothetical protein